ncbi:MAG TPA: L-histidine N(alpha)-methyltransferase [Candidatus Paceibacterota bacterium]|nr:L-histidine N(alpha)-methyltransferase [Verrucomicrobiota bacterium]HRY49152.1 L-histidine N(alpha)-methyltransferase [Candidatus Paceibacterota bacterium]HSA00905.1 L-histidine N(alpha)-methyltransferase [Candidatus Paceibacterota bacterium]
MSSTINVFIHSSQFPDAVRKDLLESMRRRAVNHKFHYDTIRQAQKWLCLHETYSPARTRPEVANTYHQAFRQTVKRLGQGPVQVIGLGCGGGAKDCALIRCLEGRTVHYRAVDVSTALVLKACQAAGEWMPPDRCLPLVCDLATAEDLPAEIEEHSPSGSIRILTFFGMLPNFEPAIILPRLAALVKPDDCLLCSANLAPGDDYRQGVERVRPLYDNALTRDWLMTFLSDLGVEADDGTMRFSIEEHPAGSGLLRIAAYFEFLRGKQVRIDSVNFDFQPSDVLRLFFSYRHTPALVKDLLAPHGLSVDAQWISPCGEEGVFLASARPWPDRLPK